MARKVIVGVAGGGKTAYAMGIIERELRNGVRWDRIGFSSFSRAACREAAERASRLLHEDPERLQKNGFFKTIHSAALRCLGVDSRMIVDHDTVDGKKFLKEACGSDRVGEPGTMAGKLDEALSAWDLARSRLLLLKSDDGDPGDQLSELLSQDRQDAQNHTKTHCFGSASAPQVLTQQGDISENNTSCSIEHILQSSQRFHSGKSQFVCPCGNLKYNPIEHKELERGHTPKVMCPSASYVSGITGSAAVSGILGRMEKGMSLIQRYERHKKLYGRIDYTDILLLYSGIAIADDLTMTAGYPAGQVPDEVQVWMFDEYQDCSPLLARAAQRLSEAAGDVYMLGDGCQAIFGFSGASTAVFRDEEMRAKESGNRIVLNRTWRNTDRVIEWGESVLREDQMYETRNPFGEAGEGSAALLDRQEFDLMLPSLAGTDSLIISRAWFSLEPVKKKLDDMAVPWRSCQEEKASRWQCPAKIAFTLVMRELAAGVMISEQDFRRVTVELPAKWGTKELFVRGTKAKWKKFECSGNPQRTLVELKEWGATEEFVEFVKEGKWRKDMPLLLDRAIDLHGIDEVRNPSIRLGSVHSVKGLEARNVFCLADSTIKVATEGDESEERCLKYVAITRSSMHYRLVVNRLDISRGKPLFWAAPKGEETYEAFNDPGEKRHEVGKKNSVGDTEVVQNEEMDLDSEVRGRNIRNDGMPGFDSVSEREVRRTGSQEDIRDTNRSTTVSTDEDSFDRWDIGGCSKFG
jgi:superfamily I DNA/RNA helicase